MRNNKCRLKGIGILYEDRDLLVVDKPPRLLTMGTDRDKVNTAYYLLTDYVRKGCARSRKRIFIVHRLDRDTSGVLVFAKNEKAKHLLQSRWERTKKRYLAVVYGTLAEKSGSIITYLAENRARFVYSTPDKMKGRLSRTDYRVLKEGNGFSLLEIDLITGRKNQIRVHLAEEGHPVVGDKKYGENVTAHRRLALHAAAISFDHPYSGKQVTFNARIPGYFDALVG